MALTTELQKLEDHKVKILLTGRLNAVSVGELKEDIRTCIEEGNNNIIVDLHALDFLDSSGLAALVSGLKLSKGSGGYFRLFSPTEQVSSVFKLTRLNTVFEIYDDEASAWEGKK
ncbi:STAS domain-containing protein [Spirochaeta cellobiosiphila]|uniref:STAS domain-containing protein n=1 Tax=Spirochaeta cellobiosiphila TaxID=504483 RepID=UPI0004096A38|nr:STAS domain-containing protein [Spirochaeta cellobiosiphila]